jgi:hypothetical protein
MIIRRLVVFSGFDTRVVERARQMLHAHQTETIFTKLPSEVSRSYFDALLEKLANLLCAPGSTNVKFVGGLVSCLVDADDSRMEKEAFFPALRRIFYEKTFAKDVGKARALVDGIIQKLTSPEFLEMQRYLRPAADTRLALPLLNADASKLRREMEELYDLRMMKPTAGLEKDVVRLKAGRGLRIKGIDFRGTTNDSSHPVRRCTDSHFCDVSGSLRLGISVPVRFEFDVSCESGLGGKTFYLCDGTAQRIGSWVSHLNMRI